MPSTTPLVTSPSKRLFRAANSLPTPSLVYDLEGLDFTVSRLHDDLKAVPGAGLNVALKATHNPTVLRLLASRGLGADAASIGEYRLARAAGFREISATGPSFTRADQMSELQHGSTTLDVTSIDQLEFYGTHFGEADVGIRLRIPLPSQLDGPARFGANSRFGILATDPALTEALNRFGLTVTRLHVHTGQLSPRSFLFILEYLLTVSERIESIDLLDLGGGFYDFYSDRRAAQMALTHAATLVEAWTKRTGRQIRLRIEPGAALIGPHGFFVTAVEAVERNHPRFGVDVIQVDMSAWNFAPWHIPQVMHLDESRWSDPTTSRLLSGNTLYENDFFGMRPSAAMPTLQVPNVSVGDRLVITNAGAYTISNSRDFNLLGTMQEFAFDGTRAAPCHTSALGVDHV